MTNSADAFDRLYADARSNDPWAALDGRFDLVVVADAIYYLSPPIQDDTGFHLTVLPS
jgi:hypothetical protein